MPDIDRQPTLRDQALDWLLLLEQSPEDEVLCEAVARWRLADPAHDRAYADAERVWRLSAQLKPTTQAAWTAPLAPVVQLPVRRRPVRRWIGAAVAAALVMAAAPYVSLHVQADYLTGVGEQRQVTLPDGSQVTLDSDSAIALDFAGQRRDVRLLRGQAWFEVAHDASRPFHVRDERLDVRVTGTAFEVERGHQVAVTQGSVQVSDRDGKVLAPALTPGQRLTLQADGSPRQDSAPVATLATWRQGQLVADDERLDTLIDTLSRYTSARIWLRDDSLAGKRVTGVYDLRDPQAALEAALRPHGGRLERLGPVWVIARAE